MTIYFNISITNRVLEAMLVSAVTAAVAFGGTMLLGECKELPAKVCTSMSLVLTNRSVNKSFWLSLWRSETPMHAIGVSGRVP